jgi:hypothetical protein
MGEVHPLTRFEPQFRRIWRKWKRKSTTFHSLRPIHSQTSIAINCGVQIADNFNELLGPVNRPYADWVACFSA